MDITFANAYLKHVKCVSNAPSVCFSERLWLVGGSGAAAVPRLLSIRCLIQWHCPNAQSSAVGADPEMETCRLSSVKVKPQYYHIYRVGLFLLIPSNFVLFIF